MPLPRSIVENSEVKAAAYRIQKFLQFEDNQALVYSFQELTDNLRMLGFYPNNYRNRRNLACAALAELASLGKIKRYVFDGEDYYGNYYEMSVA